MRAPEALAEERSFKYNFVQFPFSLLSQISRLTNGFECHLPRGFGQGWDDFFEPGMQGLHKLIGDGLFDEPMP